VGPRQYLRPALHERIMAADTLVLGTPIWLQCDSPSIRPWTLRRRVDVEP
jgi:hypothetical protein